MSADTDRRKDRPPQKRIAAKTDRSEIVPYLGSSSGYNPRILPQTQPCLCTSEVGRFLRKRQCKGSRIAAKTDRSEIVPYLGSSSDYIREAHTNHPQSSGRPDGS